MARTICDGKSRSSLMLSPVGWMKISIVFTKIDNRGRVGGGIHLRYYWALNESFAKWPAVGLSWATSGVNFRRKTFDLV